MLLGLQKAAGLFVKKLHSEENRLRLLPEPEVCSNKKRAVENQNYFFSTFFF